MALGTHHDPPDKSDGRKLAAAANSQPGKSFWKYHPRLQNACPVWDFLHVSVHSNRGHNEQNADSLVLCRGIQQVLTPHHTCVPESLQFARSSIPERSHSTRVTIRSVADSQNIPLPCLGQLAQGSEHDLIHANEGKS